MSGPKRRALLEIFRSSTPKTISSFFFTTASPGTVVIDRASRGSLTTDNQNCRCSALFQKGCDIRADSDGRSTGYRYRGGPRQGGQEIEVGGGGKERIAQGSAVYRDHVCEPQRQIGEIIGQDFLRFAAEILPFVLIHFRSELVG